MIDLLENITEEQLSKIIEEEIQKTLILMEKCWKGYEKKGMKKMFGKMYPNCVKKKKSEGLDEAVYKLKRGSTNTDLD